MTDNHRKECDGPPSDYDLEKQLKAMDRFLDLHESNILRMETPVTVLNPERNFFDEFIDIQCTPAGQNFPFQYTGAWDGFFEAWKLVGSLLSNAMSSFEQKDN